MGRWGEGGDKAEEGDKTEWEKIFPCPPCLSCLPCPLPMPFAPCPNP
ncbi:hypothetical protein [Nostoc linckia]|nr:hypothetical protein [Nostoc linckia]